MPLMCKQLLQDREIAKDKIKYYKEIKPPNLVLLLYWTSLSNALKLLANSIYGVTGNIFSNLYYPSIAPSVTAYSHLILQKVIKFVEQEVEVIYGNTGLIFIALKTLHVNKNYDEKVKRAISYTKELQEKINK